MIKEVLKIEVIIRELKGKEVLYIKVPRAIATNEYELGEKGLMTYLYFATKHGIDNSLLLRLYSLISWCGYTPKTGSGKSVEQFLDVIKSFKNIGLIDLDTNSVSGKSINEVTVNDSYFAPGSDYTYLYLDELQKVMNYKSTSNINRNNSVSCSMLMSVLVYLRYMINKNHGYNCFIKDIAKETGINEKSTTKALDILKELDLIRFITMKREYVGDKWYTNHTIFVNQYYRKRNNDGILVEYGGEGYYKKVLMEKKEKLDKLIGGN